MKIFIYILVALSAISLIFNTTKLDFDNLLVGDSATALITIAAAACVIILLMILLVSRKISEKTKR